MLEGIVLLGPGALAYLLYRNGSPTNRELLQELAIFLALTFLVNLGVLAVIYLSKQALVVFDSIPKTTGFYVKYGAVGLILAVLLPHLLRVGLAFLRVIPRETQDKE